VRAADSATIDRMRAIDHADSTLRVGAERACLDVLDGSCRTPIGVLAELSDDRRDMRLRALVAATDGSQIWRAERNGPASDADAMARDAGAQIRAEAGEAFFEALADLF
jgi:hydroxymethylbilane synthase